MATRIKEKAEKRNKNKDKRPNAAARYVRISPRKARIVIDTIRGKAVGEAQAILLNTPKSASGIILKVLNSAIANAENNMEMSRGDLYVAEAFADQGPTEKRMMPRAKGQASHILKRSSHIHVILDVVK